MATDPYRSYNFKLDINGISEGHFTECSGLSVKVESIPYREAGANQIVRKIPGPVDYATVTLKYGVTNSRELWDWLLTAVNGKVERKNVSIILLDSEGTSEVMRWNLHDAWPSEWQGAGLNTTDRAIAIDSLTLVFDSLERA
ncbi:MAG: phage tail protein [Ardenticatenaceae bacterium]|nr:phage tail protein [Ardenticatenaceae bacterium]